MKTLLTLISATLFATSAWAVAAFFTGQMEIVTTVTSQQAVKCQYNYNGQKFWRVFVAPSCPMSVEVQ